MPRSVSISLIVIAAILVGWVMVAGADLLIPFAIALLIWFLINGLKRGFMLIPLNLVIPGGRASGFPGWLATGLAIASIFGFLYFVIQLVTANVTAVQTRLPDYGAKLQAYADQITGLIGMEQSELLSRIPVEDLIGTVAGSVTTFAGNTALVVAYVFFLLLEQAIFQSKFDRLFPDPERNRRVALVLAEIEDGIERYMWLKTLVSLITGGVSYVILLLVGVDYAEFWAFFIFLLNYIPNIGSLIATIFPALLALVQFDTYIPALIVLGSIGSVQVIVGNVVEPRLMGDTLNISPLVVMLALVLWGSIWGIAGAFLSVPLTAILILILAQFETSRGLAILLSHDGKVGGRSGEPTPGL